MAHLGINFPTQVCNFRQKMGPQNGQSNQHFKSTKTSFFKIQVLVVDDDSTSLAIVSTMLKKCGQKDSIFELSVVTVKSPLDALSTLRLQHEVFDLVVTDLHMPEMNGIELQRHVIEEFKLPVVIMSSDDKESSITESLEYGAAGYLVKPAKPDDVKNVWQYAVSAKKGKSIVSEIVDRGSSSSFHEDIDSSSSVNDGESVIEDSKKRKNRSTAPAPAAGDEEDNQAAPRKAKVVWTDALHHRFLQALHHFGPRKSVPKKILEFMNVPGLKRENIASHLQKYRLFLQRVTEKRARISNFTRRRSVFATGEASFMRNMQQQKMRASIQSALGRSGISSALTSPRFGFPRLPSQATVLTNSALQGRRGTTHFLGNPARFQQPTFGKTENPLYQEKSIRLMGMNSNSSLVNLPLSRGLVLPYSLKNAASGLPNVGPSTMQMHQQLNQVRLSNVDKIGATLQNKLGPGTGNMGTKLGSGIGNIVTINNSYSFPSNNSYTGMRMTGYGGSTAPRQNLLNGVEAPSGYPNVQGLANWNPCGKTNVTPMGNNGPLGYLAGSVSNASGFSNATTDHFPPGFAPGSQQNSSMLPPISQQQHELGNGGKLIQNQNTLRGSNSFGDISNLQQFGEDDLGLEDRFLHPSGHLTPYQQQSGAALLNDNLLSSSYCPEGNTSSLNSLMNPEIPSSYNAGEQAPCHKQSSGQLQQSGAPLLIDNFLSNSYCLEGSTSSMNSHMNPQIPSSYDVGEKVPCNKQSSGQLQQSGGALSLNDNFQSSSYYPEGNTSSMNSLVNPEIPSSHNVGETAPCNKQPSGQLQDRGGVENFGANNILVDDHFPTVNQQQSGGNLLDAELSEILPADNDLSESELWTQEFLDSFFWD